MIEEYDGAMTKPVIRKGRSTANRGSLLGEIRRGMADVQTIDRGGRIYASQGGLCRRQTMLMATISMQWIKTPAATGYMVIGSSVEDMINDALYAESKLMYKQYKLPSIGLNVGGYVDSIVFADKIRLIEIKTCGNTLPPKAKHGHREQALVYAAVTGLEPSVLYFSRNVATYDGEIQMIEHQLHPSDDSLYTVMHTLSYGFFAIQSNLIPEVPPDMKKSYCGFCPLVDVCWNGDELPDYAKLVTKQQHLNLLDKAEKWTDQFMHPSAVLKRRNGTLKHILRTGTEHAKTILSNSDWDSLV